MSMTEVKRELLDAEDVATLIGMRREWVYQQTRLGRIPAIKLGRYYRYKRESIEAWWEELEQGG